MTIERLSFPEGLIISEPVDVGKVMNNRRNVLLKKLAVGVHDITPPHLFDRLGTIREIEVFEDGTAEVRGKPDLRERLSQEGDKHYVLGKGNNPQELRAYEVLIYRKGKSPKR